MAKITFEDYCNQPAFPVMQEYYTDPVPGITRLKYFTAKVFSDILHEVVCNGDASGEQQAKNALYCAREMLRVMYNNLSET